MVSCVLLAEDDKMPEDSAEWTFDGLVLGFLSTGSRSEGKAGSQVDITLVDVFVAAAAFGGKDDFVGAAELTALMTRFFDATGSADAASVLVFVGCCGDLVCI